MQSDGQNLDLKPHQHELKSHMKINDSGATGLPKSTKNGAQERSESDLGSKSVLGHPKSDKATPFWIPFGHHLDDLGRHFGHHWAPRDPKIKHFGTRMHQNLKT